MSPRIPVTFAPAGVTSWVDSGATVLEAARAAGVLISAPCGGRGVCGKCAVKVIEGELVAPDELEKRGLSIAPPGVRLSCRARADSPVTIRPLIAGSPVSTSTLEPAQDEHFVAAVDLGTSTVSAVIVGSASGRELGRAVVANRQQVYGADVISRIAYAVGGGLPDVERAAVESVVEALEYACGKAGACFDRVTQVVFAGNTAMMALLLGADVTSLATTPFAVPDGITGRISSQALSASLEHAEFWAVPPLGAMVGGDVSAGLLTAGVASASDDCVFIDIGTNAEMVVRWKGHLAYASAAAGPAFEGWGLSNGGPAVAGAIVSVAMDSDALTRVVVGGGEPAWIAGSGLVSAVALLLALGHLDETGALSAAGPLADRFGTNAEGVLRVDLGVESAPVFLSQLDVRAFQTAKAAIAAGLLALARHVRLKPKRVERLVLAGSFGSSLAIDDLVNTGVIPQELSGGAVLVNDAALVGAASVAFDHALVADLESITRKAEHVELAADQAFTEIFIAATALRPFTLKKGFV